MKTFAVLLLLCSSCYAVSFEEIAAQRVVVEIAQAGLDSLTSEAYAEAVTVDSTLGVAVYVATRSVVTGNRDPMYVDVDIPYSAWESVYQRLWAVSLKESGIYTIDAGVGRYTVHYMEAQALVDLAQQFIEEME